MFLGAQTKKKMFSHSVDGHAVTFTNYKKKLILFIPSLRQVECLYEDILLVPCYYENNLGILTECIIKQLHNN